MLVWKLDRLARSLKQLILHVFGALAEFERELIRDRTNAGLKSAKARG